MVKIQKTKIFVIAILIQFSPIHVILMVSCYDVCFNFLFSQWLKPTFWSHWSLLSRME